MASSGLRQRRTKKALSSKDDDKKKENNNNEKQKEEEEEDQTLLEVFMSHPLGFCLVRVFPFILLSYGLYTGYYFVLLQHPHWVSSVTLGTIHPRPAVTLFQERQVLIVGTMSSGTTQVASDLKQTLGLEIGHEDSDAQWSFVRDGTVSWFHGIRFLPAHASSTDKLETLKRICMDYSPNMGFHPQMYHASSKCSSRFSKKGEWNNCWVRECIDVLEAEWGCAIPQEGSNRMCRVQYAHNLLQVRNPLRTMESLVAKFCMGGMDGNVQPAFDTLLRGLFPNAVPPHMSCIEAAAYYVVNYTNAILQAQHNNNDNNGGPLDGVYQVERTSPCQVASLAGLYNASTTIYPPNHEIVMERCTQDGNHQAQYSMTSSKHRINVDMVTLTWSDLEGGKHGSQRPKGTTDVQESVRALFETLGYDPVQEVHEEIFDF